MDFPFLVRVGLLGGVGDKLFDEQAEGLLCLPKSSAGQICSLSRVRAKFPGACGKASEVGDVNETDLCVAPKMIVHLRDRGDARSRVLEGILYVFPLRVAGLDAKQTHD